MPCLKKTAFLSLFFLILALVIRTPSIFPLKTIAFALGLALVTVCLLLCLGNRDCRKRRAAVLLELLILLLYLVCIPFSFKTKPLSAFGPSDVSISEVRFTLYDGNKSVVWSPTGGAPAITEDAGDEIRISGGSGQDLIRAMQNVTLRNYWRPGVVESETIYDLFIQFKQGEQTFYLELIPSGGGVLLQTRQAGGPSKLAQSYWLLYNDLATCIDDEIYSLLSK